jgi:hypothetical protein
VSGLIEFIFGTVENPGNNNLIFILGVFRTKEERRWKNEEPKTKNQERIAFVTSSFISGTF